MIITSLKCRSVKIMFRKKMKIMSMTGKREVEVLD
jgi:hypothetical protein